MQGFLIITSGSNCFNKKISLIFEWNHLHLNVGIDNFVVNDFAEGIVSIEYTSDDRVKSPAFELWHQLYLHLEQLW